MCYVYSILNEPVILPCPSASNAGTKVALQYYVLPRPARIKWFGWDIEGLLNYFVACKENDPVVLWLASGLLDNISVLQPSPCTPRAINILFSLMQAKYIKE